MALAGRYDKLVLTFEMFPRSVQPVLNRWVDDELGVNEFLKLVNWSGTWRYDARFYLPMFQFARLNAVPMYGINVDRGLVDRISEKGWDGVPVEKREGISKPAPPTEEYLRFLASSFRMHAHRHESKPDNENSTADLDLKKNTAFSRFVQGQQLWDRAMAQGIAELIKKDSHTVVIGIMGGGHIAYRYGVPYQLADLGVQDAVVLLPSSEDLECTDFTPEFADGIFALPAAIKEQGQKPRLGVTLEPLLKGARIVQVFDDSVAAVAGLRSGDVIVEMAGNPMDDVEHFIHLVREMPAGTWLPITVRRGKKMVHVVAKFPPH